MSFTQNIAAQTDVGADTTTGSSKAGCIPHLDISTIPNEALSLEELACYVATRGASAGGWRRALGRRRRSSSGNHSLYSSSRYSVVQFAEYLRKVAGVVEDELLITMD